MPTEEAPQRLAGFQCPADRGRCLQGIAPSRAVYHVQDHRVVVVVLKSVESSVKYCQPAAFKGQMAFVSALDEETRVVLTCACRRFGDLATMMKRDRGRGRIIDSPLAPCQVGASAIGALQQWRVALTESSRWVSVQFGSVGSK